MTAILTLAFVLSSGPIDLNVDGLTDAVDDWELNKPVVVRIQGNVNESTATKFASDMAAAEKTGQSIIPIVINSYGGSVYSLLNMMDTIAMSKAKIATVVVGKAMSAGAALLTCGDEGMRYAMPNATVMIHEVSSSSSGKLIELITDADEATRLNTLMLRTMSKNIGEHDDYLANLIHLKGHADWFLTADIAKEHNIVNHIGMPTLKVSVSVSNDLVLE